MKRVRWTPEKRAAFLAALADTGIVSVAARRVELSARRAYELREEDEEFAEAWDEALEAAIDTLELEARRRAHEGIDVPVMGRGGPVLQSDGEPLMIKHYSDRLLTFLLSAKRRDQFGTGRAAKTDLDKEKREITHDGTAARDRLARRIAGLATRLGAGEDPGGTDGGGTSGA